MDFYTHIFYQIYEILAIVSSKNCCNHIPTSALSRLQLLITTCNIVWLVSDSLLFPSPSFPPSSLCFSLTYLLWLTWPPSRSGMAQLRRCLNRLPPPSPPASGRLHSDFPERRVRKHHHWFLFYSHPWLIHLWLYKVEPRKKQNTWPRVGAPQTVIEWAGENKWLAQDYTAVNGT